MLLSHYRRGFTLLEGLATLTVLTSLLVLGAQSLQQQLETTINQHTANQLRTVTDAAKRHVQAHYGQLPQNPSLLTSAEIQRQNPRSELLQLLNKANAYQQTYTIFVKPTPIAGGKQPTSVRLVILTTGGQTVGEQALRQIARQLPGPGGYISRLDAATIKGSQGGWSIDLNSELELATAATPGHLASLSYLYADDIADTHKLLHRSVSADPQLNNMETDLHMQQHAIQFNHPTADKISSATISAGKMRLQLDSQSINLDADNSVPEISVSNATNKTKLRPEKISVHNKTIQQSDKVAAYSGSELHAQWNKVPYYELKGSSEAHLHTFASDKLCSSKASVTQQPQGSGSPAPAITSTPSGGDTQALSQVIGRLFMLGTENKEETRLYLCTADTQAQIVQRFSQELLFPSGSSSAATKKTEGLPSAKLPRSRTKK